MYRLLLFLGFMSLSTGLVYMLIVGSTSPPEDADISLPQNVLIMEGVEFKQQDGNQLKYVMSAAQAVFHERHHTTDLRQVKFTVFDAYESDKQKIVLHGTAGQAVMDQKKGTIILREKVELLDSAGTEIRSDRLEYNEKTQIITSPGAVWLKARDTVHQGKSLVYDIARQNFTMESPRIYQ